MEGFNPRHSRISNDFSCLIGGGDFQVRSRAGSNFEINESFNVCGNFDDYGA
jgi:hypothetical protein